MYMKFMVFAFVCAGKVKHDQEQLEKEQFNAANLADAIRTVPEYIENIRSMSLLFKTQMQRIKDKFHSKVRSLTDAKSILHQEALATTLAQAQMLLKGTWSELIEQAKRQYSAIKKNRAEY